MKEKMDRFNEDEELRLAAYNRELNIMAHEGEKKETFEKGKIEKIKEKVLKYFHKIYPNEDDIFLNDLNQEQYDIILDMLFEKNDFDDIKSYLKKE